MYFFYLLIISLAAVIAALFVGVYDFSFAALAEPDSTERALLLYERLPRSLGAFAAGAALGLSSAIFSSVFRNQLASPYTLGISSGAGFGAAVALFFGAGVLALAASALFFALAAIAIAFALAARARFSELALLLCGLLVGSLFTSLIAVLKYAADPLEKLPAMVFFLMGQATLISLEQLEFLMPILIIIFILAMKNARAIDILSLGASQARAFGIATRERLAAIVLACAAAAVSVGLCGIIGWVGISASFLMRLCVGPASARLLPAASVFGGCYLLAMDCIIRASTGSALPLGALCGLFSLPILCVLIALKKVKL